VTDRQFETQINRLNSQWPRTYGNERKALLWQALSRVEDEDFASAVDICLAKQRAAPLLDELDKACNEAKNRRHQGAPRGGAGFYSVLEEAALKDGGADKDFVRACMSHLNGYLGKIRIVRNKICVDAGDRARFLEGCDSIMAVAEQLNPKTRRSSSGADSRPDLRTKQSGETL
jgi:hypothetical protein